MIFFINTKFILSSYVRIGFVLLGSVVFLFSAFWGLDSGKGLMFFSFLRFSLSRDLLFKHFMIYMSTYSKFLKARKLTFL